MRVAAVGQPFGPDLDHGALDDRKAGEQLGVEAGEISCALDFLVHSLPGADLDATVFRGAGHDQQLIGFAFVLRSGEFEALPVNTVAAETGFARSGPPVVEHPVT
ncbi:hypothetical protein ACFYXQ_12800 [Nocardia jiangxiensis]|uniref:Uncharacterized protein n=1 Tax=Nocardia jiangxiensis TaxID=282685 RepID=A0ABW6S0D8_9NOCA